MKTNIALALALLAVVPATVIAAPVKHKATKVAAATKYECVKCHMVYSAAEAKKDHYKCDMDGGKLVPMKSTPKKSTM